MDSALQPFRTISAFYIRPSIYLYIYNYKCPVCPLKNVPSEKKKRFKNISKNSPDEDFWVTRRVTAPGVICHSS